MRSTTLRHLVREEHFELKLTSTHKRNMQGNRLWRRSDEHIVIAHQNTKILLLFSKKENIKIL
jgi:hypothetical protein